MRRQCGLFDDRVQVAALAAENLFDALLRRVRALYALLRRYWRYGPGCQRQSNRIAGARLVGAFVVAVKVDCKATDVLTLGVSFEGRLIVIQSIETWKDIVLGTF